MLVRLEKVNHIQGQSTFYVISVEETLFGEWCVCRKWGRIGARGGQERRKYFDGLSDASAFAVAQKAQKQKRGYGVIAEQMWLFDKAD
jgi:predicted DNA-binding WGR domain protein